MVNLAISVVHCHVVINSRLLSCLSFDVSIRTECHTHPSTIFITFPQAHINFTALRDSQSDSIFFTINLLPDLDDLILVMLSEEVPKLHLKAMAFASLTVIREGIVIL